MFLSLGRELKNYWTRSVQNIPGVKLHTFLDDQYSGAVATFGIEGMGGGKIVRALDREYDIHAKSVGGRWGSGVRISVNVFTSTQELDHLIQAIEELASS